jgi:diaminopimelate epimerase
LEALIRAREVRFTKYHGAGNDYIVIDGRFVERDWPALARAICNRNLGAGADGIALVVPSERCEIGMRIFNPDGSEAEMSGNGIRCFTRFVVEKGIVSLQGDRFGVETPAGIRTVIPRMEGGRVVAARVNMGTPRFHPDEIPVRISPTRSLDIKYKAVVNYPLRVGREELPLTFVSMGNPHAVAFLERPVERFPLQRVGRRVEHHPIFPNRVNFEIANKREGGIKARIWERGAGETLASGTGACAVAVAARLLGLAGDEVDIILQGGVLTVQWDGVGEVWLEGPVEEVYEGEWKGQGG